MDKLHDLRMQLGPLEKVECSWEHQQLIAEELTGFEEAKDLLYDAYCDGCLSEEIQQRVRKFLVTHEMICPNSRGEG